MTVTFAPEIEEKIAETARARGLTPDAFVQEVVTREIRPVHELVPLELTVEEFVAELNRIGKDLPALPPQAYTRESFYEDHD